MKVLIFGVAPKDFLFTSLYSWNYQTDWQWLVLGVCLVVYLGIQMNMSSEN